MSRSYNSSPLSATMACSGTALLLLILTRNYSGLYWEDPGHSRQTQARFFLRWGVGQTQAWMPTYVSILHIRQMICVWRATVEWYWQEKTEELQTVSSVSSFHIIALIISEVLEHTFKSCFFSCLLIHILKLICVSTAYYVSNSGSWLCFNTY
jgi:hypothetical protein